MMTMMMMMMMMMMMISVAILAQAISGALAKHSQVSSHSTWLPTGGTPCLSCVPKGGFYASCSAAPL
eukprot:2548940-Karenia_brevis.AAC.1